MARALVQLLRRHGLWLDFRFVGRQGAKRKATIGSDDALATTIASWKPGEYALLADERESFDTPAALLSIGAGRPAIMLIVSGAPLEERRQILLDDFASFAVAVHAAFDRSRFLFCSATVLDPYPQPRPPQREEAPFSPGTVMDVYDLATVREYRPDQEVEAIVAGPLPPSAERTRKDDLVVIRWARDLRDGDALSEARSQQALWMRKHLHLDRHPDFNAVGDRREMTFGLVEHPPLTFLRPDKHVGYKAVAARADGSVDEEEWREIIGYVTRHRLPDGARVDELRLIVPVRPAALALHERAVRAGISAVLYTDDNGSWWDPFPPGPWLDPPASES